jgi:hypothetical protein
VRVRATIVSVDSGTLTAKARDGGEMRIKLADNAPVNEVVKAQPAPFRHKHCRG